MVLLYFYNAETLEPEGIASTMVMAMRKANVKTYQAIQSAVKNQTKAGNYYIVSTESDMATLLHKRIKVELKKCKSNEKAVKLLRDCLLGLNKINHPNNGGGF